MIRKHFSRAGRGRTYAGNHIGVAAVKATRDRAVPVRTTATCPSCKAAPGDPCVRADGLPTKSCHPARRRAAISILRERGEL